MPYCFFFRSTEMRTISRGILRYTLTYHGWYNHSTPNIELVRYEVDWGDSFNI
jgi:hypothetical protein